jgi:hypothetical protein
VILLLAAAIVFFFLALGSVAFLICTLIPLSRKYALSTALWFAVWGPCCVLLLILVILGIVAGSVAFQATQMRWEDAPRLFSTLGWGTIIVGGILTCVIASVVAWLHQWLIHRFTFVLFRPYATLVSAGIGSVFGWLSIWLAMVWSPFPHAVWLAGFMLPILMIVFGAAAYLHARALRGNAPTGFTWISPEEFAGPSNL